MVEETGPRADGGIDLVLTKDGEETIVQAKQWKKWDVGVKVIREFFRVQVARRAAGEIVVTSGRFTGDAERFAAANGVELIDGKMLERLIEEVRKGAPLKTAPVAAKALVCPLYSGEMVKRRARNGPRSGESFWGCGRFPAW